MVVLLTTFKSVSWYVEQESFSSITEYVDSHAFRQSAEDSG